MGKGKIIFGVVVGLFFSFLISAVSGFLLWLFLPRGGGVRYTWRVIHNWSSLVFTLLVTAHLILHWGWIKTSVRKIFKLIL